MDLHLELVIDAPAERVWHALGERFMHIADWAAPITSSCPVDAVEPGVGVTRACTIAPVGPVKAGVVTERLILFDRQAMRFEYEATSGLPSFIARAVNRWSVTAVDARHSRLSSHATLTLRGPMVLFSCVLAWRFRATGTQVAEELKYFVETGEPHPRKARGRTAPLPRSGSAGAP